MLTAAPLPRSIKAGSKTPKHSSNVKIFSISSFVRMRVIVFLTARNLVPWRAGRFKQKKSDDGSEQGKDRDHIQSHRQSVRIGHDAGQDRRQKRHSHVRAVNDRDDAAGKLLR